MDQDMEEEYGNVWRQRAYLQHNIVVTPSGSGQRLRPLGGALVRMWFGELGGGNLQDSSRPDPMLVWIMGHSYVVWAALRAAVRPDGRQLGLSRETVTLRWIGKRGMVWKEWLPEFHRFVRLDRVPEIVVIHLGGNDLAKRSCRELIKDIKFDILRFWVMFPKVLLVWSDIIPRKRWRGARSHEGVNRARIKINRAISRFMVRNGALAVRHVDLESGQGAYWRADGVHLNAVGHGTHVYLMSCPCGLMYVGETTMEVRQRISKHKSTIRTNLTDLPIPKHFSECRHSVNQLRFRVIDGVPTLRRGGDRNLILKQKELRWISVLGTLQPKGLNLDYNLQICTT
ncbi:unnamed protein product [Ranitomeya imitator]|uniref:GIY-YIG domain-containing protein n=1 Tax=Ranitomeya imitator TaxID=111125 RepID=A0ABN9MFH3_9NEOB|nr:unnamed protein product [Ranitomeya imitator]